MLRRERKKGKREEGKKRVHSLGSEIWRNETTSKRMTRWE